METTTTPQLTVDLPERLADVFRSLRSGKHICRDDLAEYRDLERNEDVYRAIFQGLGYELIHHGQGFYYFKGGNTLTTQRLQGITLFILILFQDLEDKKFQQADRAWERKLLMRTFHTDELPHFQTSQRRSMLFTLGVTPDTLNDKVLRPMARYGILEIVSAKQFQFRSPVFRFIDVCMQFAEEEWGPNASGEERSEYEVDTSPDAKVIEALLADEDDESEDEP